MKVAPHINPKCSVSRQLIVLLSSLCVRDQADSALRLKNLWDKASLLPLL